MVAATEKRLLVVDDHPLLRAGLATILATEPDLRIVAEVDSAERALAVVASTPVDLAIVDIMLPHGDGIQITRALRSNGSTTRVLGLSVLDEPVRVVELLRAGATGFAHKTQPAAELIEAVRATLAGVRYICPALRGQLEELLSSETKMPLELLTAREREVFVLLVRGMSNEAAGRELAIAPRTVETHRQRVMKKLQAHSVAELVRLAARWGTLG